MTGQGDRIQKVGNDRWHIEQIAILEQQAPARFAAEIDIDNGPDAVLADTFEPSPICGSLRGQSASQCNQLSYGFFLRKFIDRWTFYRSDYAGGSAHGRHEYNITRQQLTISTGIASQQKMVKIEGTNDLAIAFQLDLAQRTDLGDAAAQKQCMRHR